MKRNGGFIDIESDKFFNRHKILAAVANEGMGFSCLGCTNRRAHSHLQDPFTFFFAGIWGISIIYSI